MRRALLFLILVSCSACHTKGPKSPEPPKKDPLVVNQPVLQPFARAGYFVLTRPLVIHFGEGQDRLVVPAGFVTDFASIPRRFRGLVSKLGPHLCPAIVHDYLYYEKPCSRPEADRVFLYMMEEMSVPWATRRLMYHAVRGFGRSGWQENSRRREEGLTRVIPPYARDIGPRETWPQFREYLKSANGHFTPVLTITPGFCSYPKTRKAQGEA